MPMPTQNRSLENVDPNIIQAIPGMANIRKK
jgi:hypothetical protein